MFSIKALFPGLLDCQFADGQLVKTQWVVVSVGSPSSTGNGGKLENTGCTDICSTVGIYMLMDTWNKYINQEKFSFKGL